MTEAVLEDVERRGAAVRAPTPPRPLHCIEPAARPRALLERPTSALGLALADG